MQQDLAELRAQIRAVSDRQQITEVLVRYMAGIDAKDAAMVRSAFHPDAVDCHQGHEPRSLDEFMAFLEPLFPRMGATAHYLGGASIDLDGEAAVARYPAIAFHRLGKGARAIDSVMGARVVDRLERRAGEWRIAHRVVTYDWNHDRPAAETWGQGVFEFADG